MRRDRAGAARRRVPGVAGGAEVAVTPALVTGAAQRLALGDGTGDCGLAPLHGLWYNMPVYHSAGFVFYILVGKSPPFWHQTGRKARR